jgi:acetyl esterase/lipase
MKRTSLFLLTIGLPCLLFAQCQEITMPFGQINTDTNRVYKMLALADGNFVLAGEWNGQASLLKINAQGQQLAFQRYGNAIGGRSFFRDIIENPDGSLVVAGECKNCAAQGDLLQKVILLKTQSNLELEASIGVKKLGMVTYPNGFNSLAEQSSPCLLKTTKGYALATTVSTGAGINPSDLVLHQLNENLVLSDSKVFNYGFFESPYSMTASNKGYLLAVNLAFTPNALLLHLNADGTVLWSKTFAANVIRGVAWQAGSNEAVVLGERNTPTQGSNALLIRFNANNGAGLDSLLWGDRLADEGYDLKALKDGNLIAAVRSTQPNVLGTYVSSRIFRIAANPLRIIDQQNIPNPDVLTSMNVSSVVSLNDSGENFAAAGIRGFYNRSFFHLRNHCSSPNPSIRLMRETYGVIGKDFSTGQKILRLPGGGLVLGGQWNQVSMLVQVDCAGKIEKLGNLQPLLGDSSLVKDILLLPNGDLILSGTLRRSVASGKRYNRIFTLRCGPDLVPNTMVGLRVYAAAGNGEFNHDSPKIKPFGTGYALSFSDDFFGGNLHLALLDQNLNWRGETAQNFSFIESKPQVVVNGNNLFVAENVYLLGEFPKFSLSKYEDKNNDGMPELIWERKKTGGEPQLLLTPDGKLLLASSRPASPNWVLALYQLDLNTGQVIDSLVFPASISNMQPSDLQISSDGTLLFSARHDQPYYFPTALPVYRIGFSPKLSLKSSTYLSNGQEFFVQKVNSIAPTSSDGSQFMCVGEDNGPHPRLFLAGFAANTCLPVSVPLNAFSACSANTLITPECPSFPLCEPKVIQNIIYRKAVNAKGQVTDLKMDVYLPRSIADQAATTQKRPLVILIHGGGFVFGNEDVYSNTAISFAQHGFITASFSYRLGMPKDSICGNTVNEAIRMNYRAIQDAKYAYNYLISNAAQFYIDTSKVYIHGFSAGGMLALSTPFWDNADNGIIAPIVSDLGILPPLLRQVKAIVPMGPPGFLSESMVDASEQPYTYLIEGTCDEVAPFLSPTISCPGWPGGAPAIQNMQTLHKTGRKLSLHLFKGAGHGFLEKDEPMLWDLIRKVIKNKSLCGNSPQYECLSTDFDLSKTCANTNCPLIVATRTASLAHLALKVFPNPSDGVVQMEIPEILHKPGTELWLHDLAGRLLYRGIWPADGRLDFSTYASGTYWLKVVAGEQVALAKVIRF